MSIARFRNGSFIYVAAALMNFMRKAHDKRPIGHAPFARPGVGVFLQPIYMRYHIGFSDQGGWEVYFTGKGVTGKPFPGTCRFIYTITLQGALFEAAQPSKFGRHTLNL